MALNLISSLMVVISMAYGVSAMTGGSPTSACTTLTPNTGASPAGHGAVPTTTATPYTIVIGGSKTTYSAGEDITVSVSGGNYKGILLQVRVADDSSTDPVGVFKTAPTDTKLIQCSAANDAMTNSNANDKTSTTMYTWTAPANYNKAVKFVATIVQAKITYYLGHQSSTLTFLAAATTTAAPAAAAATTTLKSAAPSYAIHSAVCLSIAGMAYYGGRV